MLSFILSRRDFREFDQIISLYTLEKGKVEVLARGVKKITSKNAAHLEPFCLVEAEIIPGKEINHLGGVVSMAYFANIRADLSKSLAAGFVVGMLDNILHEHEPDARIFNLTHSFLDFINIQYSISNIQLLDCYIVKLLNCLGFDITKSDGLNDELKRSLEALNNGDWQLISNFKFQISNYKRLHQFIYNFVQYHLERKIDDWSALPTAW